MSECVEVRLLLAKFPDDDEPVVVAGIDRTIWEHWEESDEAAWLTAAKAFYGLDPSDLEWREVWASFAPDDLAAAYRVPVAEGEVVA